MLINFTRILKHLLTFSQTIRKRNNKTKSNIPESILDQELGNLNFGLRMATNLGCEIEQTV